MSRFRFPLMMLALAALCSFAASKVTAEPTLNFKNDKAALKLNNNDADIPRHYFYKNNRLHLSDGDHLVFNDDEAELGELETGELKLEFQNNELKESPTPAEKFRRLKLEIELKNTQEELSDKQAELEKMKKLAKTGVFTQTEVNRTEREVNQLKGELEILTFQLDHPETGDEEIEEEGLDVEFEIDGEGIELGDLPYEILERVLGRTEGIREDARRSLLRNLRDVVEQLENDEGVEFELELEEEEREHEREEHHPEHERVHRQIERLMHAAELLEQAGETEQAEKLFQKAERLERELKKRHGEQERHHEGRVFEEIFKELRGIKEELQDVHREVQEIRKLIEQDNKKKVEVHSESDRLFSFHLGFAR